MPLHVQGVTRMLPLCNQCCHVTGGSAAMWFALAACNMGPDLVKPGATLRMACEFCSLHVCDRQGQTKDLINLAH